MKNCFLNFVLVFFLVSCSSKKKFLDHSLLQSNSTDFTIAFGSCNQQNLENKLWPAVFEHVPDVWIWGGDIIYADTDDMKKMADDYKLQKEQANYQQLVKMSKVLGTWDDHDYGLNDGGYEYRMKNESQQLFLDFLDVPKNDIRRSMQGVYHSEVFDTNKGSIKVIVLDTRFFRTELTKSTENDRRYQPNDYGKGTILGELQWLWLENELNSSKADFNIIVSGIQVLSQEHQFEKWANFPQELEKLQSAIKNSKAKGVFIISGDRHLSEFSKIQIKGMNYPLIDFTSSGLTHSYSGFSGELNNNRIGNVVSEISFGVLKFDFKTQIITMEMRGEKNKLIQKITQKY